MKLLKKNFVFLFCILAAFMMAVGLCGYTDTDAASNMKYEETDSGIMITKYTGKDTSVTIPSTIDGKSVVEVGESAFAGNITIKTVSIPASVKKIDAYAFESSSIKTVKFATGLETIGKGAFSGCGSLTGVTLPSGLVTMEDGAFLRCISLKSITIPASVKSIGTNAFALSGLTSVTIPKDTGLTELSDRLFWKSSLASITLPQAIKKIGNYTFAQIEKLKKADLGGTEEIGKGCFWKSDDCVVSSANSLKVIGEDANICFGKDSVLPSTLTDIAKGGIGGVTITKTLTISSSVTNIEGGAFTEISPTVIKVQEGNPSYASVDGVLFTKDQKTLVAFPAGKSGSYKIPDNTQAIGAYAFANIQSVTGISIPDSVTSIGEDAFYKASNENLSLVIPQTVTIFGNDTFRESYMKKLTLNSSVEATSEGMFADAEIEQVVLPETLKEISDRTFFGSTITVTIPKSVEKIDDVVFLGSKGKILTEDGGSYTVDGNLLYNSAKTELVSYVNQNAEDGPKELTLADGVTKIDDYAIVMGSELNVVNVPDTVEEVGKYSFGYSNPMMDVSNYNVYAGDKNYTIYSDSQAVKDYARTNALSCFQGKAKLNLTSVTMEGDGDVQLKVKNADSADVIYSSNNQSIATVSSDGIVTGQRKGSTIIVAAVGHTYFRCNVTVTSNAENPATSELDETLYNNITKDQIASWETLNTALNKNLVPISSTDNIFTKDYKGNDYYSAIKSIQPDEDKREYIQGRVDKAVASFGEGYESTMQMMNHGLAVEMGRYKTLTDTVLYSGTNDIKLITGLNANMNDLQAAIGQTYTIPISTSTSLDETVPINFGDITLIFYADKDAIDGGYIEGVYGKNSGESEILLSPGTKVKILDVGVRYVKLTALTDDNKSENGYHYERYVKCALVTDKATRELNSFNTKVNKTSLVYNGKAQSPAVTVKAGEKVLKKDTDYTLTYSNNKNVGVGKVTVKGKGKYTGTFTKTFNIIPMKSTIKKTKVGKKKVKVWMKNKASTLGATAYQIQYRVKGTKKWKSVTTKNASLTLKKLKKGKKYQIAVRAYKTVNGKNYYGAYSKIVTTKKVKK